MVSDLLEESTGTWNRETIMNCLPQYAQDILSLKLSHLRAGDRFIWLPSKSGIYTTKTGYHSTKSEHTRSGEDENSNFNWHSKIWNGMLSPKLKLFMWKVVQGAISLGENLAKRGIITGTNCPHCGEEETATHLFLHCQFSYRVWSLIPLKAPQNSLLIQDVKEGLKLSKNWITLPPTGVRSGNVFPWVL